VARRAGRLDLAASRPGWLGGRAGSISRRVGAFLLPWGLCTPRVFVGVLEAVYAHGALTAGPRAGRVETMQMMKRELRRPLGAVCIYGAPAVALALVCLGRARAR
jgi:hypothetical protein